MLTNTLFLKHLESIGFVFICYNLMIWWVGNQMLGGVFVFVAVVGERGEERKCQNDDLSLQTAGQWSIESESSWMCLTSLDTS